MKKAQFYETKERDLLQCHLCPHECNIGDGKTGICQVRKNLNGDLYLSTYGTVSSMGFDPVEKKPLYHFYPGKFIFSVGNFGCNMHCKFCQNWQISQSVPNHVDVNRRYDPDELVNMASGRKTNLGIAYTYNEPFVWFEYMQDIAKLAAKKGLKNVMVTNGFINPEPLEKILDLIDAFNVDLKAFNEHFYKTQTMSRLEPVKESMKRIRRRGKHIEITNLVITNLNDDQNEFEEMVKWIQGEIGKDIPLHISRYFPTYKSSEPPTDPDKMHEFYLLAREYLDFVYMGNISLHEGVHTYCPDCGRRVVERNRYDVSVNGLDEKGNCANCGYEIFEYI